MASPLSPTRTQFSDAITPRTLQVTRLIHAAIMTGPVIFLIIVVAFSLQQTADVRPMASSFELMNVLSMVQGVLALASLFLAQFLSGALFSLDRLQQGAESITSEMLAAKCVALQRAAGVARLAILEGVALFGLAVCFAGVMNHVMQAEPAYWFNAASTGLFLAYAAMVFPTKDSLVEWFEKTVGSSR